MKIKGLIGFIISFILVLMPLELSDYEINVNASQALIQNHVSFVPAQLLLDLETLKEATTPYIEPQKDEIKRIKITATGDLMVHEWQMRDSYVKETGEYDFSNDFEMVTKYLEPSDYTIGNLETVFAGKDIGYSDFPMFNTPDSFGTAIKEAGFDLLTTANNHSLDKREAGLLRTLDVLDDLGIEHIGTYRSEEESQNYKIVDIGGFDVAFLSYTYGTNGIPIPKGKDYLINTLNEQKIISDLNNVKELGADIIVLMPHMGNEYELYPNATFKTWANLMMENGADIVIASHPHVLQPMELKTITMEDGTEKNAFIMYSMGNFISSQRTVPRDYSMILNITISQLNDNAPVIEQISFIPTWVQFRNQAGQDYVRVLSVYDALKDYENGIENNLRPVDINRMKQVHKEITKIYFGESIPYEDMQNEYVFYEDHSNIDYYLNH